MISIREQAGGRFKIATAQAEWQEMAPRTPQPSPPAAAPRIRTRPATPAARAVLWALAAIAAVVVVSSFGLPSRLVWDDLALIGDIDAAVDAGSLAAVFEDDFFGRGPDATDQHYYRPLVQLTYALGALAWDRDPFYYGLSNLVFHGLACGLLFALLGRFGSRPEWAALGVVLFGLMPRLTESVFWISGRTDVLATVFVLAALLAYDGRPDARLRRIGAAGLLFLGLLCKEVAVAGLVTISVIEAARAAYETKNEAARTAAIRALVLRIAPLWLAFFGYLAIRLAALDGVWHTTLALDPVARGALAGEALGRYATMVLDPLRPALRIGSILAPRSAGLAAFGVAVAIAAGALLARQLWLHPRRGETTGLVLAGASLALVLHVVPIGSDTVAADRFLYMPIAGLVLAGVLALGRLPERTKRVCMAGAAALGVVFALACIERADQWSSEIRLWHHTVERADPHDAVPHSWMGIALLDRGEPRAALAHFQQALRIEMAKPPEVRQRVLVLEQLGNASTALSALGRDTEALHAIEQALSFAPAHVPYRAQRARLLGRLLRFDEARAVARAAIRLHGPSPEWDRLLAELDAGDRAWAALPAPNPSEPIDVRVRRARVLERLGAIGAANAIWSEVADHPEADDALLVAAATFQTFRASPDRAEALLERVAARSSAYAGQTALLRAALAERRLRAVPEQIVGDAMALEQAS